MDYSSGNAAAAAKKLQTPVIGRVSRAVFHPELSAELRAMFRNPEALAGKVEIIKNSRSTTAGIFVLQGECYFWKRSNVGSLTSRLRRVGRTPRSEVNRRAAARLEALGVRTPKVWASIRTRSVWGIPGASYLITEGFPAPMTAADNLDALLADAGGVAPLAERFARMLYLLHEAGFEHGDLKLYNFLALPQSADKGGWELGLFDLDGAHLHRRCCSPAVRQKDLARTASSMYIELYRRKIVTEFDSLEKVGRLFAMAYWRAGGGDYTERPFYRKRLELGWMQWKTKYLDKARKK